MNLNKWKMPVTLKVIIDLGDSLIPKIGVPASYLTKDSSKKDLVDQLKKVAKGVQYGDQAFILYPNDTDECGDEIISIESTEVTKSLSITLKNATLVRQLGDFIHFTYNGGKQYSVNVANLSAYYEAKEETAEGEND